MFALALGSGEATLGAPRYILHYLLSADLRVFIVQMLSTNSNTVVGWKLRYVYKVYKIRIGAAIDSRHMEVFQLERSQSEDIKSRGCICQQWRKRGTPQVPTPRTGHLTNFKLGVNQQVPKYFCRYHWEGYIIDKVNALHVPLLNPCIVYGE